MATLTVLDLRHREVLVERLVAVNADHFAGRQVERGDADVSRIKVGDGLKLPLQRLQAERRFGERRRRTQKQAE